MAILSFNDNEAEKFFNEGKTASKRVKWHNVKDIVSRKLDAITAAKNLGDLKAIPGNHLKKLQNSFYSIRVNNKWRIIFKWTTAGTEGAEEVEVTDYH